MARLSNLSSNLNAFLDMIAVSELGYKLLSVSDDGYNIIVGSTPKNPILFNDYKDHPRRAIDLPNLNITSTAAGRYQILKRYFDHYKVQLGLQDFSPESQDLIAIQLIKECSAKDLIESGRFKKAVKLCRSRWASLPGSGYGQHENKMEALERAFVKAGGYIVTM